MRQVVCFDWHDRILSDLLAFFVQPGGESRFAAHDLGPWGYQVERLTVTEISYRPGAAPDHHPGIPLLSATLK
jgi:hypothetical protein